MVRAGIICEFNPLHNGHARLIAAVRAAGAKEIICVMAGDFVQRCEPALLPQYLRAEAAVRCGADAVFSLPFPYCCASAELYAGAAVYLLSMLGCDTLAFGSESGDLDFLSEQASKLRSKVKAEAGTATAYDRLLPNDILGTEYIRAARRLGCNMSFFTLKREGSAHDDPGADKNLPSASALRNAFIRGEALSGMPEASLAILEKAAANGETVLSSEKPGIILHAFWRTVSPGSVSACAECTGGVGGLLHRAALQSGSYPEMMRAAATKKYTDARLRRACLYGYLGVTADELHARPAYVRELAQNGRATSAGPVAAGNGLGLVRRVRDYPAAAERQRVLEEKAEALYTLCLSSPVKAGAFFSKSSLYFSDGDL